MAEREGFEPPIGLHLCRISSAVRSTTLPPLRGHDRAIPIPAVGRVLGEDGGGDKAPEPGKSRARGKTAPDIEWDRQTREKPAVPCRFIEIAAGKCGFAGQLERRLDGSDPRTRGNAIPVLT